jgi:hypothetical protein
MPVVQLLAGQAVGAGDHGRTGCSHSAARRRILRSAVRRVPHMNQRQMPEIPPLEHQARKARPIIILI